MNLHRLLLKYAAEAKQVRWQDVDVDMTRQAVSVRRDMGRRFGSTAGQAVSERW